MWCLEDSQFHVPPRYVARFTRPEHRLSFWFFIANMEMYTLKNFSFLTRLFVALFIILTLASCGGGGGGSSTPTKQGSTVILQPQNIHFENEKDMALVVGESYSNTAKGEGSGAITYTSSDEKVARVDSKGNVSALGAGDATITAKIAEDDKYFKAYANYSIKVKPRAYTVSGWLGDSASKVEVSGNFDIGGTEFYRSSDADCDLANYSSCTDGAMDVLPSGTITDSAARLDQIGYYTLIGSRGSVHTEISGHKFDTRVGHQALVFNDRIWVIGGARYETSLLNDVWSSADGASWVEQTSAAAFSARYGFQAVVFKNKMFVIGGMDAIGPRSDVWSSADGKTWVRQTASAAFAPRFNHQVVVFNNKLWLIGGTDGSNRYNDVWSSADGIVWTQEAASAAFSPRQGHNVVEFKNKLWLFGGFDGSILNDIWSSVDGRNWHLETAKADFPAQLYCQVVVKGDEIWINGGTNQTNLFASMSGASSLWASADGINWKSAYGGSALLRHGHQSVVFHEKLWVIGGMQINSSSDVWASEDGNYWSLKTSDVDFEPDWVDPVTTFQGKLWHIGYYHPGPDSEGSGMYNSSDGLNWKYVPGLPGTLGGRYSFSGGRYSFSQVAFNNKLWIIGGEASDNLNDVWSSVDGSTWVEETSSAGFSPRWRFGAVAFNNRLWVIGGIDDTGVTNDIWSSADGITWVQEMATAPFVTSSLQVVTMNSRIWVISAKTDDFGLNPRMEVWSSANGRDWTLENDHAPFESRGNFRAIAFQNKLWVIGGAGHSSGDLNDVWSSSDGKTWTQEFAHASFSPRLYHELAVMNNQLFLYGGFDFEYFTDIWKTADGVSWEKGFRKELELP